MGNRWTDRTVNRDSHENCHQKGNTLGASVKATRFSSDLKRAIAFFLPVLWAPPISADSGVLRPGVLESSGVVWRYLELCDFKISSMKRKCHSFSTVQFSSVAQSCLTLQPHGLQHTRLCCPSPIPRAYSNSCPLSRWCHPTICSTIVCLLKILSAMFYTSQCMLLLLLSRVSRVRLCANP